MTNAPYVQVWESIERARKAHEKFNDMEKWLGAVGALKGKTFARSTWFSYQRWFRATKGQKTSPTVSFLGRVTDLLHLRLVLRVESAAAHLHVVRNHDEEDVMSKIPDPDVLFVAELMAQLPPEARTEVRRFALSKVGELASDPRDGDEPDGPRSSPK